MEMLSPIAPVTFDRTYGGSIATSPYYTTASSTTSSSSPDLTTATTVSTALTNDSDDESYRAPSRRSVVPKIEEIEEDNTNGSSNGSLHAIEAKDDAKPPVGVVTLPPPRKKRGRPRKHPIVDNTESKKASHARSKTGCGTCRRRKKKCDETKPACMNCEKNNVVCDGYEPKQPWRSGKQKAQQSIAIPPSLSVIGPGGVETNVDQDVLCYFTKQLSLRLSLTDESNPFKKHILPMACKNVGIMHGVLFLTSSCILAGGSAGNSAVEERKRFHQLKAFELLKEDENATLNFNHPPMLTGMESASSQGPPVASTALMTSRQAPAPESIAQALILCLEFVADGKTTGGYRHFFDHMKDLLLQRRHEFQSEDLYQFILEFLLYHDYSSYITSLKPTVDQRSLDLMEDFKAPHFVTSAAGSLLGVMDGLFGLMSRIRQLRVIIRDRRATDPSFLWITDPEIQEQTYEIDRDIRAWTCRYPPESPRFRTSLLYRQTTWVYLRRTVFASRPDPSLKAAVDDGLKLLMELPEKDDDVGAMQSVLLMPVFLLGCAAFEMEQREVISQQFARLKKWSSLGNIQIAEMIVREIWQLMDQGKEEESWDWEKLIDQRGWDLLIT